MVATLQSRKEALEAKILEKNEELKKLCLQEADLTGIIPPEIPLEPGEPPPPIRRRVGTSFSFPQNLINSIKDADDESLTALELECRVQLNIAEAALALANDSSANKAARRKHRLMYRQSQRRLIELETRLNLLKQGKSQQIKKKPRPNTTAVENIEFFWKKNNNDKSSNSLGKEYLGSWSNKLKPTFSLDDCDKIRELNRQSDSFSSLQRSVKSSGTSHGSNSPKTDISSEEYKMGLYQLGSSSSFPNNNFTSPSLSYSSKQTGEANKINLASPQHKKVGKKGIVRRQWDTQSAGGTLLPSQTYPEHSHQPNLNRTQSLGSVETNIQKSKESWSIQNLTSEENVTKEKEWYETSLDSAPSPPLRTTSRLPTMTRMLHQMQEMQGKDWGGPSVGNLCPSISHPILSPTQSIMLKNSVKTGSDHPAQSTKGTDISGMMSSLQHLHLTPRTPKSHGKNLNSVNDDVGVAIPKEIFQNGAYNESYSYPLNIAKAMHENAQPQIEINKKLDLSYPSTSSDLRFIQNNDNNIGLPLSRQNSLNQAKFKGNIESEKLIKAHENVQLPSNGPYSNVLIDNLDGLAKNWLGEDEFLHQMKGGQIAVPQEYVPKPQTPTQPYYHLTKHSTGEKIKNLQYQAAKNRHASLTEEQLNNKPPSSPHIGTHHPPHAIIQNEISFDTVVPFESPQNHTVVQAGKWQPYREVTKPFEMSDFYKYSTKFRQNQAQANRPITPDISGNSQSTSHQKGVYTPLKPMTCRPVESKSHSAVVTNLGDSHCDQPEKNLVEVSPPEIV